MREPKLRQKCSQRMRHDADVNGNAICAFPRDNLLGKCAGRGAVSSVKNETVSPLSQRLLQAGYNLKHMGILKSGVGGHSCKEYDSFCISCGKALGAGIRIVIQFFHNLAHVLGSLFRNTVMTVNYLRNCGYGYACKFGDLTNGDFHIFHPLS